MMNLYFEIGCYAAVCLEGDTKWRTADIKIMDKFEDKLHDILDDALGSEFDAEWDTAEEAFLLEDKETGKRYYVSYKEKRDY
jgi:hypothetical protein